MGDTGLNEHSLQEWMVRRIARELGVTESEIDLNANIMSLGIDSMTLIGMGGDLAELINHDLPAEIMWEHDSVDALSRHIVDTFDLTLNDSIVAESSDAEPTRNQYYSDVGSDVRVIQPHGTRPPFFLVHGIYGGIGGGYDKLGRHLGTDQPVYGLLQPPGSSDSIEGLAEALIDSLRSVQRRGPYRLGGYCFGAVVAYELARQLERQGEKVALLAMFDVPPPKLSPESLSQKRLLGIFDSTRNLFHTLSFLAWESINNPRRALTRIRGRLGRWAHRVRYRLNLTQQTNLDRVLSDYWEDAPGLSRQNVATLSAYRPQPYPGQLTLFQTSESRCIDGRTPWLWRQLCASGIDVVPVHGYHEDLFEEPRVVSVAERLGSRLFESK